MGPRGAFEIREHPLPEMEPGTALMRIELCGVCGTDVHYWAGYKPTIPITFPGIMGHEIVGIVESQNEGYLMDAVGKPIRPGDRIVPAPLVTCGTCFFCQIAKEPVKCLHGKAYGHLGDGYPYHTGGYAEYLYLCLPGTTVFKTDLPPEVAVFLEPISIAVTAVDKVRINPGETVVVQGSGNIGLLCLVVAKEAGASKTIVVGGPKARLELARKFGADVLIDIAEMRNPAERIEAVRAQTPGGYGADVVIEATGVPATVPEGIDFLRYGGRFCEAGHFADAGTVAINPSTHLCAKCITLVGAWSSLPDTFARGLNILESRKYPIGEMVSHRLPLERTADAFRALSSNYMLDGREVIKAAIAPWD
jgi:threonine dehydrogenase-like Zn-dependent dehydrogenase